jgi:hypothetical protein
MFGTGFWGNADMRAVRDDFRQRVSELAAYLRHVRRVSEQAVTIKEHATAKALRAGAYLLTYNLVEATARNAMVAVHDRLETEGVSFDDLNLKLKQLILTQARQCKPDKLAMAFGSIATDIVAKVFDPDRLFSGNVDAQKLRESARQFGYHTNRSAITGVAAASLRIVKDHRNDLAHGNKTFTEVGRDVTVEDLCKHAVYTILYMREVLRNVEIYLKNREYLARVAS